MCLLHVMPSACEIQNPRTAQRPGLATQAYAAPFRQCTSSRFPTHHGFGGRCPRRGGSQRRLMPGPAAPPGRPWRARRASAARRQSTSPSAPSCPPTSLRCGASRRPACQIASISTSTSAFWVCMGGSSVYRGMPVSSLRCSAFP